MKGLETLMTAGDDAALRRTAWAMLDFISDALYLGRRDMALSGSRRNSAAVLSLLTGLCGGSALIIGEPGLGKTTTAENVCSLIFRLPLESVWRASVSGHPEQTEEKIVGRPDLGALNRGEESVVFSHFALLPAKIVDELNRLPETKQSLILDGVDRGKWEYLNQSVRNGEFCLFATANYADQGTNTIVAPLMDRFDVMFESPHPGPNLAARIGAGGPASDLLRFPDLEDQVTAALSEKADFSEKMVKIRAVEDAFGERVKERLGIGTFSAAGRAAVRKSAEALPLDPDAGAFLRLMISELSFCFHFGQKRSLDTCRDGCHFTEYLCHDVKNCASNRLSASMHRFARILAWFQGDAAVNVSHLKTVAPFVLAHRIQWEDRALARREAESRRAPLAIHMANRAVADMHRRYTEQRPRIHDALHAAFRIAEGEDVAPVTGDHPFFTDILRDLDLDGGPE